jgi:hypothetical protein
MLVGAKRFLDKNELRMFIENYGRLYSEILCIDVFDGESTEIFKWFLASLLFGAPIRDNTAIETYESFRQHSVLTPERILATGWKGLVRILDEGGYARYDEKTADKLLIVMKNLRKKYGGDLVCLCEKSLGARNLEGNLKALGKGIGDVTISIFLRELRDVWRKSDAKPTLLVVEAGENLGILKNSVSPDNALKQLKQFWSNNRVEGKSFVHFETALSRLGIEIRRKKSRASHRLRVRA